MKKKTLPYNAVIMNPRIVTHKRTQCAGQTCCLHNPSAHHMVKWPVWIRVEKYNLAERVCKHGVGHPDPDSVAFLSHHLELKDWIGVHGCDGCCSKKEVKT